MRYTKQSFLNAWSERAKLMHDLRIQGQTFAKIGKQFGVTRQRVQQILKRNGKKK